ncbi:hypothetical protein NDU88_002073 [Pleurodeles waltl]|uniref:Uncharacterized protein n=1 Tax=Pleurodeles waltl TaxID=8319 RepID=A0AAV7PEA4_PLEWA|nr:hypothetical protein NDU88_002073 [Pleurodeles waltl]
MDTRATQLRRKCTNDRATHNRQTKSPDLWEGDTVLIKDQHPGGKFSTPFEKVWKVLQVKGTIVTVRWKDPEVTTTCPGSRRLDSVAVMKEKIGEARNLGTWPEKEQRTH